MMTTSKRLDDVDIRCVLRGLEIGGVTFSAAERTAIEALADVGERSAAYALIQHACRRWAAAGMPYPPPEPEGTGSHDQ